MPPETKPVISSLAEMTCENCVYSVMSVPPNEGVFCFLHTDWSKTEFGDFCSKGKWMTNKVSYYGGIHGLQPHIADYDLCYRLFRETKCNT